MTFILLGIQESISPCTLSSNQLGRYRHISISEKYLHSRVTMVAVLYLVTITSLGHVSISRRSLGRLHEVAAAVLVGRSTVMSHPTNPHSMNVLFLDRVDYVISTAWISQIITSVFRNIGSPVMIYLLYIQYGVCMSILQSFGFTLLVTNGVSATTRRSHQKAISQSVKN